MSLSKNDDQQVLQSETLEKYGGLSKFTSLLIFFSDHEEIYEVEDEDEDDNPGIDPLIYVPELDEDLWPEFSHPPMDQTVGLTAPGVWSIGSLMICETITKTTDMTVDSVHTWTDDGVTYRLRKRSPPRGEDRTPEGDAVQNRISKISGTNRGFWTLSPNTFCKVKPWSEGVTTEATTIRWINEFVPSIPTEKLIYEWIDPTWNRTIMISERVPGKNYFEAWPNLSTKQKLQVADQVAAHLKALSEHTSDYIETVQRTGVVGAWSLKVREAFHPLRHRIEPRVSRQDYEAFVRRINEHDKVNLDAPGLGEPFVLQHPDCSPGNILVTTPADPDEDVKLTGIIDWESVGYLPAWLIATNPRVRLSFAVEHTLEGTDWQEMLSNACVRAGLPLELEYATARAARRFRKYKGLSVENFVNLRNLLAD